MKSQADGSKFFFHPEGHNKPVSEAVSSWVAFNSNQKFKNKNNHPQCRFPERFRFLSEFTGIKITQIECPEFIKWMNLISPVGISLVFATNYPQNPGSTFGHTFLKIKSSKPKNINQKSGHETHHDLLDYSVSYTAIVNEPVGLVYAFKGIFGGFIGQYSLDPYYDKIKDYNEIEGRDLWEYELNISVNGVKRVMSHLWELVSNTYFNYYFIDENCSFHLITLLEIANPKWNLSQNYVFYTAPYETVKDFAAIKGAVKKINYRPSLYKKLKNTLKYLSPKEQSLLTNIINGRMELQEDGYTSTFLEALIQFLQLKKVNNNLELSKMQSDLFDKVLIQRSKLKKIGESNLPLKTSLDMAPDKGHDTSWVSILLGRINNSSIMELHLRPVFHDRISKSIGFSPNSDLKVFQLEFDYKKNKRGEDKFQYKKLILVNIENNLPRSNFDRPISWRFNSSHQFPWLSVNSEKQVIHLMGEVGFSWELDSLSLLYFLKMTGFVDISSEFKDGVRGGPGFHVGSLLKLNSKNNMAFDIHIVEDIGVYKGNRNSLLVSFEWAHLFNKNLEAKIYFESIDLSNEKSFSANSISVEVGSYF